MQTQAQDIPNSGKAPRQKEVVPLEDSVYPFAVLDGTMNKKPQHSISNLCNEQKDRPLAYKDTL